MIYLWVRIYDVYTGKAALSPDGDFARNYVFGHISNFGESRGQGSVGREGPAS